MSDVQFNTITMKYDWEYMNYLLPGKRKIDFKAITIIFVLF